MHFKQWLENTDDLWDQLRQSKEDIDYLTDLCVQWIMLRSKEKELRELADVTDDEDQRNRIRHQAHEVWKQHLQLVKVIWGYDKGKVEMAMADAKDKLKGG